MTAEQTKRWSFVKEHSTDMTCGNNEIGDGQRVVGLYLGRLYDRKFTPR